MVQKQQTIKGMFNLKGKIFESKLSEASVIEYFLGYRFFRTKIDSQKRVAYYELRDPDHQTPAQ